MWGLGAMWALQSSFCGRGGGLGGVGGGGAPPAGARFLRGLWRGGEHLGTKTDCHNRKLAEENLVQSLLEGRGGEQVGPPPPPPEDAQLLKGSVCGLFGWPWESLHACISNLDVVRMMQLWCVGGGGGGCGGPPPRDPEFL